MSRIACSCIGLFAILTPVTQSYATENFYYNEGWIPITREEVFGHRRHIIEKFDKVIDVSKPNIDVEPNIHILKDNVIKIVSPQLQRGFTETKRKNHYKETESSQTGVFDEVVRISGENRDLTSSISKNKHDTNVPAKGGNFNNKIVVVSQEGRAVGNIIRKAKNIDITEGNAKRNFNDIKRDLATTNVKPEQVKQAYETNNKNENKYEVIETDPKDQIDADQTTLDISSGYVYRPAIVDTSVGNNLTEYFLNVLSKHNIRPNDELPNYILSRTPKVDNPLKKDFFYPQNSPSFGYNSLNHLPVDPTLAIFLSNYARYLPGFYGIQGNYRNLYGYLASNNIHNNKPFGVYKLFSDTDSSS